MCLTVIHRGGRIPSQLCSWSLNCTVCLNTAIVKKNRPSNRGPSNKWWIPNKADRRADEELSEQRFACLRSFCSQSYVDVWKRRPWLIWTHESTDPEPCGRMKHRPWTRWRLKIPTLNYMDAWKLRTWPIWTNENAEPEPYRVMKTPSLNHIESWKRRAWTI